MNTLFKLTPEEKTEQDEMEKRLRTDLVFSSRFGRMNPLRSALMTISTGLARLTPDEKEEADQAAMRG